MSEFELYTKSAIRELFNRDRNTNLTSAGIRRGDETRTLKEILVKLGEIRIDLTVVEMQEQDVDALIYGLRKYCMEKAPVIVLDYLQIVPVRKKEASAKQGIDEIVRKLKNFQRETGATNQNREIILKAKESNPRQVELKCLKNQQGKNYSCFFEYYPAVDTFEVCNEEDFKKKAKTKLKKNKK